LQIENCVRGIALREEVVLGLEFDDRSSDAGFGKKVGRTSLPRFIQHTPITSKKRAYPLDQVWAGPDQEDHGGWAKARGESQDKSRIKEIDRI